MTARIDPRSRFDAAWRDCCRRVVELYAKLQEEKTGKGFGPTRIAKAMRELHRIPGNDKANAFLEKALKRQDIEAWLRRGIEFGDDKFMFVDAFVQKLLFEAEFAELQQMISRELLLLRCKEITSAFSLQENSKTLWLERLGRWSFFDAKLDQLKIVARFSFASDSIAILDCVVHPHDINLEAGDENQFDQFRIFVFPGGNHMGDDEYFFADGLAFIEGEKGWTSRDGFSTTQISPFTFNFSGSDERKTAGLSFVALKPMFQAVVDDACFAEKESNFYFGMEASLSNDYSDFFAALPRYIP